MPIVFDEISGEVSPERSSDQSEQSQQSAQAQRPDPAELVRRELHLFLERERRLIAD